MDFLFSDLQHKLFSLERYREAGGIVLVLLITTNHSFVQSEMRFIAFCILKAAVVTCSASVHNARSSTCSARGVRVDSWSHNYVVNEVDEEIG